MPEMTHVEKLEVSIPEASLTKAAQAVLGTPSHPVSQFTLVSVMIEYLEDRSFWPHMSTEGNLEILGLDAGDLDDGDYKEMLTIFRKLAPHLQAGSEVEFYNEDIGDFRWKFEGGRLHQQIRSDEWHTAV